ncbi:NAD(+) synthase, partial [Paraburkholderia sp. BR14262]
MLPQSDANPEADRLARQHRIIAELNVAAHFDAHAEIEQRVRFLGQRLLASGLHTLVLGISGGIDSATAGRLAQLSVERLRAQG